MNSLTELKNKFKNAEIDKHAYMDQMNVFHNILFDYQDLLSDSLAEKIDITDQGVIVTLRDTGIKLHCIKNDRGIIPLTILNFGEYEERLWQRTAKLIGTPQTVLDIGGNIGYFSLYFAHLFPDADFYCFEPITPTFSYLKKNLEINKTSRIFPFNFGLSDKKQTTEMFYNPQGCGSSSLQNLLNAPCTHKISCDFSTIDDFVQENMIKKVDFIKIDVEGAELFVLKGGLKTIERDRPLLFCEMLRKWSAKFDYHPNDIIRLMKEFGYSCYAIHADGMTEITEVTEQTVETNFIFKAN